MNVGSQYFHYNILTRVRLTSLGCDWVISWKSTSGVDQLTCEVCRDIDVIDSMIPRFQKDLNLFN